MMDGEGGWDDDSVVADDKERKAEAFAALVESWL